MIYERKKRVFLADDHQVVVEALKSLISEKGGFEVVGCALDGLQLMAGVESLVPDIVVMDISMPQFDAVEAVRDIRNRFSDIQVIIFSMFSDSEHIVSLYKAGICGYVLKEQPISELMNALETVSEGGVFYSKTVQKVVRGYMEDMDSKGTDQKASEIDTKLSKREKEVLPLLADGMSAKKIAERLYISPKTVESHKYNILQKLDLESVADLTKLAIKKGLISL